MGGSCWEWVDGCLGYLTKPVLRLYIYVCVCLCALIKNVFICKISIGFRKMLSIFAVNASKFGNLFNKSITWWSLEYLNLYFFFFCMLVNKISMHENGTLLRDKHRNYFLYKIFICLHKRGCWKVHSPIHFLKWVFQSLNYLLKLLFFSFLFFCKIRKNKKNCQVCWTAG